MRRLKRLLQPALALALLGISVWALSRAFRDTSWADVAASLSETPPLMIAAALGLIVANYLTLSFYDWLGLNYLGHTIRYRRTVTVSSTAYGVSNAVGLGSLGAVAVRLRLYARDGLGPAAIAKLSVFTGLTIWLGFGPVAGTLWLVAPPEVAGFDLPPASMNLLIGALLALPLVWIGLCAFVRGQITVRGRGFFLPPMRIALGQVVVSAAEWVLVAATLFVLVPEGIRPDFAVFAGLFLLGQVAGLLAHVPGGVGVLDAIVVWGFPEEARAEVAAALLLFRVLYHLIPLSLAGLYLAVDTWRR